MGKYYTENTGFYKGIAPEKLVAEYGSPLYVYSEDILRQRCREMKSLSDYEKFAVNYSIKANSNLHLLKIVRDEGLYADAMSPGEIHVLELAGFSGEKILFIPNNVSLDEMAYAVERGITVSVDSMSQLALFGKNFPNAKAAIRFNTGYGAGHHEKVITAGKKTKFGINDNSLENVKEIVSKYKIRVAGINQHIGSLFMEGSAYLKSAELLCSLAYEFPELEFIDLGGGFGITYKKQEGEKPIELAPIRQRLNALINAFVDEYGSRIAFKIEPGRYIAAECGVLLGTVHALKYHAGINYVGTDLGFNVLQRPVMYDAYHEIEVYRGGEITDVGERKVTIVGNICESGDKLVKDRVLPEIEEGDMLGVMDAGAYGYSMASNYNNRLRPAEVLIASDGSHRLIRRRDTMEDLVRGF